MGDVLATITREAPPRVFHEPATVSLPRTAVELRRERARTTLAATIPLLIFALTVISRVWAPDLVPFGLPQAAALDDARRLSGHVSIGTLLSGSAERSSFAVAYPLLDLFPSPVEAWIAVRALLDGLGSVLVFLVARSLAGRGAGVAAALVYGLAPWAWVLARDPAAVGLPALAAGALLAATRVVRAPRLASGLVAGLLTGLLVRVDPAGWAFLAPLIAVLVLARVGWGSALAAHVGLVAVAGPVPWSWGPISTMATSWSGLAPAALLDLDPVAAGLTLWTMAGGVGVERRLIGIAELPASLAALAPAVLGCVAGLLGVGVWRAVELARSGRRDGLAVVAGAALPPVVLLGLEGRLRPELLHSTIPALAVVIALAAAPFGRRSSRLRPVALVLAGALATVGGATIAGLLWSATSPASARSTVPFSEWANSAAVVADATDHEGSAPPTASLRFWQAVADEARDAAARTGRREIAVIGGESSGEGAVILASLLGGELTVRSLPPGTLPLPVEHEAAYLLLPGVRVPPELAWPSARLGSVPLSPTDAVARVVTLRPRPVPDWLALHTGGQARAFADGRVLVAARSRTGPDGAVQIELVWLTGSPEGSATGSRGVETVLTGQAAGGATREARAALPAPPAAGGTELVVQRLSVGGSGTGNLERVSVRLVDGTGAPVPATGGSPAADGGVEILGPR